MPNLWDLISKTSPVSLVAVLRRPVRSRTWLALPFSPCRYMAQSKHAEARELMCSGALLFFSHGQTHPASLARESLAKLFSLMDPNSPERVAFVSRALKWSSGGSGKLGHPRLHQLLARTLWKGLDALSSRPLDARAGALSTEQNYCESRYHFLHSSDGEGCANMLVEYSTARGFRSEVDMFVAQAVLQFLCLKNKSSASVVFTTYTRKHPSIESGPPFVQPLLNFIWFLLLAVDGGKLTVFTVLCEQYQPSLRRDPICGDVLARSVLGCCDCGLLRSRLTLCVSPQNFQPHWRQAPGSSPLAAPAGSLRLRARQTHFCGETPGGGSGVGLLLSCQFPVTAPWEEVASGGVGQRARCSRGPDSAVHLLPGNLLSSLMGSSEQEGEDSQDDSSPIELD
ncbi:Golgi to ER traffic protein [Pontoporia blainvillei]|uniref:Golgi to ER traffic protein n=1 Tax=Pontoporia blainvillei TaxID=48723 RepID=A0ABX0RYW2_PONBL|nr:Golgi to ER traffic protein [Pontoporia blainvillei]